MRILVAMSGGVDSSVVAHMLKAEGHDLVGVMMKLWIDPLAPIVRRAIPTKCCSVEHIQRARSVCEKLKIPFYVKNLEDEFKRKVVDPFLRDYAEGKTPNPCITCNRVIKFGALLDVAKELGCEKIATGHYARIAKSETGGRKRWKLLEAVDTQKDQSYFLYGLSQEQLGRCLFPLGDLQKEEVFKRAKKFGVPLNDSYRESQDLCFFPEKNPKAFLKRYLTELKPGPIETTDGREVGRHEGLPLYTVGQRRGLGIGGLKIPLHVVEKRQTSNTIVVAESGSEKKRSIEFTDPNWIPDQPEILSSLRLQGRTRSLGRKVWGRVKKNGNTWEFGLEKASGPIAAGQAIVLYDEDRVIGGGTIVG